MQQETTSTQQEKDAYFMGLALGQAKIAGEQDEVPIGAVVVYGDHVIAQGYNRREIDNDPAGHAEFIALKKASEHLGAWRLSGCTVYVTLEPCLMCAGLMYQARIDRCVYGAADSKAGALGSLYSITLMIGLIIFLRSLLECAAKKAPIFCKPSFVKNVNVTKSEGNRRKKSKLAIIKTKPSK